MQPQQLQLRRLKKAYLTLHPPSGEALKQRNRPQKPPSKLSIVIPKLLLPGPQRIAANLPKTHFLPWPKCYGPQPHSFQIAKYLYTKELQELRDHDLLSPTGTPEIKYQLAIAVRKRRRMPYVHPCGKTILQRRRWMAWRCRVARRVWGRKWTFRSPPWGLERKVAFKGKGSKVWVWPRENR
ncbi:hypothetical protein L873DRAFT_235533 [Choiromyces venosus 120613-1]|uniref:Uncharacterized protein n=1 Tax=Choiromyces venosus 120613-1 TaxID=1336337 RepID=A0A3N4K4N4_9PEZI|nr:hypothetical protein L873DRAFT_235533 [Choiromyces venosus 120613-1]